MPIPDLVKAVDAVQHTLTSAISGYWYWQPEPGEDPLALEPNATWPNWGDAYPHLKRKQDNWFYCTIVFPETFLGATLAGQTACIFMNGYTPFTLWIDGEECFHETRPWHGTGPIADPIIRTIEPGRPNRFVMSIRPTDLPASMWMLATSIQPMPLIERVTDLMAVVAELQFADLLASPDEKALVATAAAHLTVDMIERQDWVAITAATARVEVALAPFAARAKALELHLIGHTHIDMDWQWTWDDTVLCARRDTKAAVELMTDFPDLCFSMSQVPIYEVARELDPDVFARIRDLVQEGRWENVAATWVEGDLHMADGESVARHALYAALWSDAQLGRRARVFWEPDTFGHPGNMPQLARLAGCDTYFHWRCNPGRWSPWPARIWTGVDGSEVMALSSAYGGGLSPWLHMYYALPNMAATVREGGRVSHHVWGVGDHGGGMSRHQLGVLARWRDRPLLPTVRHSTIADYRRALLDEGRELPRNHGETYHLFEGCFTTHARHKAFNRQCEQALLHAEVLCALAGHDAREPLADAWKGVLFNQFHDLLDGAAVPDAYVDAEARHTHALAVAAQVAAAAQDRRLGPATAATDAPVVLTNTLAFPRSELLTLELPTGVTALRAPDGAHLPVQHIGDGRALVWTDTVDACASRSYTLLTAAAPAAPAAIRVEETKVHLSVETPYARWTISRQSGVIGSGIDRRNGRELVDYGVEKPLAHVPVTRLDLGINVFQIQDEAPNAMSAWHINDILRTENLLRGAEISLIDVGPVCARVAVTHTVRNSVIRQEIRFYAASPRVDFHTEVDWQEVGSAVVGVPQLKTSFGSALSGTRTRYEGPFVVTERPANGMETVSQKWTAVTGAAGGYAVYNRNVYGCDSLGARLRLTLMRTGYGPDPRSDRGVHAFDYAYEPLPQDLENAELSRRGASYNRAFDLRRGVPDLPAAPTWRLTNPDILVTSFRLAETRPGRILRLFDVNGRGAEAELLGCYAATAVNFLEDPIDDVGLELGADRLRLRFRPFEVKTLLLPS